MDEAALSRELAGAVRADATRRAVDDMKKRSILTARSYDEFRHLVACAEDGQRAVSSRELAFLGSPGKPESHVHYAALKAGAHGAVVPVGGELSAGAREVLARLAVARGTGAGVGASSSAPATTLPTTPHDFERFWRRTGVPSSTRFAVLLQVEPSKVFKIEVNDLGGIVKVLLEGVLSSTGDPTEAASPSPSGTDSSSSDGAGGSVASRTLSFLGALVIVSQFAMAQRFLTKEDLAGAASLVSALAARLDGERERELLCKVAAALQVAL
jgi:hypothetical protein